MAKTKQTKEEQVKRAMSVALSIGSWTLLFMFAVLGTYAFGIYGITGLLVCALAFGVMAMFTVTSDAPTLTQQEVVAGVTA